MASRLHTYISYTLRSIIPLVLIYCLVSCATIVTPTGGPKDITPPKVLKSEPKNLSTNFNGKRIVLTFDEYIQLKTPEKFMLISPPLSDMPDMKLKGHSLIVKIKDTLRANTTYNFYFGNTIVDLSEGNPLANFNFSFSTGPDIDSLSLSGTVTDAFTRMPVKSALVMLYNDFTDSVPMKKLPMYVSRTMDNGSFKLNCLASGKYRAVALVDGNSDYLYNLPTEMVGFSQDTVIPYYNAIDLNDTIAVKKMDTGQQHLVSIDLFPEPDSTQRILKSVIASKNRLSIAFRYGTKSPTFRVLNMPDSLPWSIREWNRNGDTLNAWLINKPDTLHLEIFDRGKVIDTVRISTAMKVTGRNKNASTTRLHYSTSLIGGMLGYNKPLSVSFGNPVKDFDLKALSLTTRTKKDTNSIVPEAFFTDSIHRHLMIIHAWKSEENYDLYIPRTSFIDIYSDTCDSTHVAFQTKSIDDYGNFAMLINRKVIDCPIIVQLMSEKGTILDQKTITNEKRIDFGLLPPGKYSLKAIMDANANGRWDTGKFLKKIQPERVLVHPKIFEVRTNWELEETWDL